MGAGDTSEQEKLSQSFISFFNFHRCEAHFKMFLPSQDLSAKVEASANPGQNKGPELPGRSGLQGGYFSSPPTPASLSPAVWLMQHMNAFSE